MDISVGANSLVFRLTNSKPSIPSLLNAKAGIGLSNVKKRLGLLYPSEYKLLIRSSPEEFFVEMQIPVDEINSMPATVVI